MTIHSAPPYLATPSYVKMCSRTEDFPRAFSLFQGYKPMFSHVLCCTMKSAFLTLNIQQAINLVDSSTVPLPSPPTIPLSHQPPLPYLLLLTPPAYLASSVQLPSVILAIPLGLFCSKVPFPHWCSLVLQSICLPLAPLPVASLLPCLLPNLCSTDRVNDRIKELRNQKGKKLLIHFLSPAPPSPPLPPTLLREEVENTISRTECGWNCTGKDSLFHPRGGGKRV